MRATTLVLCSMLFAGSALAQTGTMNATVAPKPEAAPGNPLMAHDFAKDAAMSDLYEVTAGKVAEQRGRSTAVKDFARHMVSAHTQTSAQLKDALKRAGMAVALPASLDSRHAGMVNDLRSAAAQDFDRLYIQQQSAAHQEALTLLQNYAGKGDNAVLRKAASQTVPIVESHIRMLGDLQPMASERH